MKKTNIKRISDYDSSEKFNQTESALFQENSLNPEDYEKLFPDMNGQRYFSFKEVAPRLTRLKNTPAFINFIERNRDRKIVNITDYDTDGVMSCVIMITTLRKLNIDCDFVVPNRLEDGYGISKKLIDKAIEKGASAIITTDNGISAKNEIQYAISKGLDVLITDHHMATEGEIPENVDIIDPVVNDDIVPGICGATVAFKLCYALLKHLRVQDQYFINDIGTFAAIATVSDMMPMLSENRLIMRAALSNVNFIKERNIWNRVMKVISGLGGYNYLHDDKAVATEELFGFYIGPSINAISRVKGDPTDLIQAILDCDEPGKYIRDFYQVNNERKRYTQELLTKHEENWQPLNIEVLNEEDFEFPISGLLGLMANNLMSKEYKPSLIGYLKDDTYEFSCRSIPGYSIHDAFERLRKNHPELGVSGGGHDSAMGLRFKNKNDNYEKFVEYLTEDFNEYYSGDELPTVFELENENIDDVISTLGKYSVYGQNFKKPTFVHSGIISRCIPDDKLIEVDGYLFKAYKLDKSYEGKEVELLFSIKFDSKDGPYFQVLDYELSEEE